MNKNYCSGGWHSSNLGMVLKTPISLFVLSCLLVIENFAKIHKNKRRKLLFHVNANRNMEKYEIFDVSTLKIEKKEERKRF